MSKRKSKRMRNGEWVVLDWRDACLWTECTPNQKHDLIDAQSAGCVIEQTREYVTLAFNAFHGSDGVRAQERMSIPKSCIMRVRRLR